MEAALTYSALRTARFLVGADRIANSMTRAWWVALIAALICLTVDLILDPAVSTRSVDCGVTQSYGGAGVWKWIEDEAGWFGVPIWNFAVWFAAPISGCAIACIVLLVVSVLSPRGKVLLVPNDRWGRWEAGPPKKLLAVALLVLLTSLTFIVFGAHDSFAGSLGNPDAITALKRALVLGTAAAVLASIILWSDTWRRDEPVRWPLVLPLLFFIGWPLAWYAGNATLLEVPGEPGDFPNQTSRAGQLAPMAFGVGAAITLAIAGTYLVFSPYVRKLGKFSCRIAAFNDVIRIHYFPHTSMNVFLGAGFPFALAQADTIRVAPGEVTVTAENLWVLLGTAILFHVFMVLLNDWKDWVLDEKEPRRDAGRPIRESIGRSRMLLIALITVPAAAALNYYAGGSWLFLGIAYGGMTIYNLFGKQCRWPWVTDLIQGLAWGALALYAFGLTWHHDTRIPWVSCVLALNAIVYILLVNGCHGSMRDLANDDAQRKSTTAIRLGAKFEDGRLKVSPKLRNVANGYFVAHVLIVATLYAVVNKDLVALTANGWVFIVVAVLIWSSWLMKQVFGPTDSNRDSYVGQHALVLMLAPIAVLLPAFEPPMQVVTMVWLVLPFAVSRLDDVTSTGALWGGWSNTVPKDRV
jgi:1,4-dihydroxy-2-naphthoate octaprenyltransferase